MKLLRSGTSSADSLTCRLQSRAKALARTPAPAFMVLAGHSVGQIPAARLHPRIYEEADMNDDGNN
ncbi:hypothetical protein GCM10007147_03820 [Nocardiopsis kunsanensis]|uniref:Uncharacterized protein n=1 Tax=Nocardiopsis kunsanensis TaxID=141693 RepID=A0A918X6Y8_9ACTN|nr:hypothetical protein GCM10007147_03820 [Nocardiopsis kunsanensis]